MTIEESDFKLEKHGYLYDLSLLVVKKKKDGTLVEEFDKPIYGCSLESALRRIISYRISRKNKDGAISLIKLRDDIQKEMKFIHDIFDGTAIEDYGMD